MILFLKRFAVITLTLLIAIPLELWLISELIDAWNKGLGHFIWFGTVILSPIGFVPYIAWMSMDWACNDMK